MKHKSIHISRIILCILFASAAFLGGLVYGERTEKARITAGFIKAFQENFGENPGSGASINTGAK